MKRIEKIIIAAFSVLIAVSIVGCSSQKADPNQFRREYKEKYDNVKIGSYDKDDTKGTTIKEATDILGKPNSTSTTKDSQGAKIIKIKLYTWKKKKMEIDVWFKKNKAFTKVISGLDWKRDQKITAKDFDAVKDKSSYKNVIKKFGEPDSMTEAQVLDNKSVTLFYNLDTPKNKDKKVKTVGSLMFDDNDELVYKVRSKVKYAD